MSTALPSGFFAYPSSHPTLKEPIREFVTQLNRGNNIRVRTWEECKVGGKLIIEEICKAISGADLFLADLTGLNANVMFELGYAIARDKRIWLVLDTSYEQHQKMFEQLRILTTVGYNPCQNSQQMLAAFYKDTPLSDLGSTIYKEVIEPNLRTSRDSKIMYLKSRHANEASIAVSKRIDHVKCGVIVDDPRESTVRNITWYGEQIANAAGVLCHLMSPDREGSRLETAKYALVAGLAHGFGKDLLVVAEGDFLAPVDYRDLLKHYRTSGEAVNHIEAWIKRIEEEQAQNQEIKIERISAARLATELKGLRFGDYVAENESEMLVAKYFIPTAAYEDALRGAHAVFVGRKGSGKTANLLKLGQELGRDRRNLVCQIKPAAYEMQGIVELLRKYKQRDTKGYAIASLWKFLLYSEIARSAAQKLDARVPATLSDFEISYLKYVESHSDLIRPEFSVRLERCVEQLLQNRSVTIGNELESTRAAISETLHAGILGELRIELPIVLKHVEKVVILVNNLDKAWDKASDFQLLAEVLLGLLTASGHIPREFLQKDSRRQRLNISLVTFLRSDIFYKVRQYAREPDKIRYSRLEWGDRDILRRVIEERFVASHDGDISPEELWSQYFCEEVNGMPTRDYVLRVILPRPRDLIYFTNVAVSTAVNRRHTRVESDDILEAENQYSMYALESIVVENTLPNVDLESIIFEFVEANPVLTKGEVIERIKASGVDPESFADVIRILCGLTFFGIQVDDSRFAFAEDPQRSRRDEVQARRYSERQGGERKYQIHRAFRAFLGIGSTSGM